MTTPNETSSIETGTQTTENIKLSDQQYQLMQVLWHLQEGSAKAVHAQLSYLGLAHTTVATILTRLEKRGVLSSRTVGRERIYTPLISENAARRSMVSSLVSTLFKGDDKQLLAHLVKETDLESGDLADIQQMLAQANLLEAKND